MAEFLDRFDQMVRERAAALAIDAHDAAWSFADLDEQSRRLANRLREVGTRAGDVIALRAGHSAWHIAGMLATWRLGAAFLPVDPDAPEDRALTMLTESRARAVLSAGPGGVRIERPPGDRPPLGEPGEELAYVVYTSGSTGRPKGVRVAHSGLVPVLTEQIQMFGLAPGMRALLTLSTAFDASISDIGTALLSGAALVIPQQPATPATLAELLRSQAITHADLPPSMLPYVDPATLPDSLRTVVIGGEVCAPSAIRAWAARVRLVNVYGPTEATICTSMDVCDPTTWTRPLIGTPLAHVEYDLVDGELLISGPAVALGYVDQPHLQEQRFVTRDNQRWYRTGDLVRREGDGTWEFLGRIDRQIKIRGRLVCPEEIEARLREIDGVAEAVVVSEHRNAQVVLTGHVRSADGVSLSATEIRERLAQVLPRWMLPRVALVDSLTRSRTGKIDHRALTERRPAPITQRRTRVIAEAFAEVLGVARVGADDDFLQLGGDSLAALEVVARAQLCGVGIESPMVLTARTPAAIARAPRAPDHTIADLDQIAAGIAAEIESTPIQDCGGSDWLVTGATGFLGGRLVRALLSRTNAHTNARTNARVHCVVRAADDAQARTRLGPLGAHPRVKAYAGDVSAPLLGLPRQRWRQLTEEVGTVLHSAAALSLSLPFTALATVNVRGTAEIARFVRAAGARLHHISSLAVLAATDLEAEILGEHTLPGPGTRVIGGYPQTKWIAEALLRRSVPELSVIRPGLLTGDSVTGISAESCPLAAFLRSVAALRCLPEVDQDLLRVNITPIDRAVTAIVELIIRGPRVPVVHVAGEHGTSLRELQRALCGFVEMDTVPTTEFLRRARERLSRHNALALVTSSYRLVGADERRDADLFLNTRRRFPGEVLGSATGAVLPPVDDQLLTRYAEAAVRATGEAR